MTFLPIPAPNLIIFYFISQIIWRRGGTELRPSRLINQLFKFGRSCDHKNTHLKVSRKLLSVAVNILLPYFIQIYIIFTRLLYVSGILVNINSRQIYWIITIVFWYDWAALQTWYNFQVWFFHCLRLDWIFICFDLFVESVFR